MSFEKLNLIQPLLKALNNSGYTSPTPIQQQAIPAILAKKDLLGCAQTGTGKTAAFALPLIQLLHEQRATQKVKGVRALVLAPTRELAIQVADNLGKYGKHTGIRHTAIFGGVSQHQQTQVLRRGVDVLIATPGRLLDLVIQGHISLQHIEYLVLDEADRMLDMGFINDIRKILSRIPETRQTIFFSATMPDEVQHLVNGILKNPVRIEVTPVSSTGVNIDQSVYFVEKSDKRALLKHIISDKDMENVLVFTRTKHGADKVAHDLNRAGIAAEALHGNKSQNARQRALSNFKQRTTRVLVATDIAARGIDVRDLPFVINYELPDCAETYVHRIGRTGRAGAKGVALTFCDSNERDQLKDIRKISKTTINVVESHPFVSTTSSQPAVEQERTPKKRFTPFRGSGNNRRHASQRNRI
ncbi:MAG TPA: DEAD/DEAH box helicase [Chryseosolibacter sp.]|nr:DEAD/DEAH box helicase [Chryseosolibacter sp.]